MGADTLLFSSGAGRKVKGLEEDVSSPVDVPLVEAASAGAAFPLALAVGPLTEPPTVGAGSGLAAAAEAAAAAALS